MTRKPKAFTRKILQSFRKPKHSFWLGMMSGAAMMTLAIFGARFLKVHFELKSENGRALYTLGQLYARHVDSMHLTEMESKLVSLGLEDWAGKKLARVDFDSNRAHLEVLMKKRQDEQIHLAKEEGQSYIHKYLTKGGLLSASGFAFRVITPGSNKKPTLKDWVEVSYRGTLLNGKVFDSTDKSRDKAKLPMNGVIAGWTEGLQLIGEGGEIELVIPSELAYGDAGIEGSQSRPGIPPGATLIFRIQLHRVLEDGKVKKTF